MCVEPHAAHVGASSHGAKGRGSSATTLQQFECLRNREALLTWPLLVVIFFSATAAKELWSNALSPALLLLVVMIVCNSVGIYKAAQASSSRLLRSHFLLWGFLQMAFYLHYLRGYDTVANVHLYFDVFTNLYAVTPQLVIGLTGAPMVAYVGLIGCHVATASAF